MHYVSDDRRQLSVLQVDSQVRQTAMEEIRFLRSISAESANAVMRYWQQIDRVCDEFEQKATLSMLRSELEKDIGELRALRSHLEIQRDKENTAAQLDEIHTLLALLDLVCDKVRRRYRKLVDDAFVLWMTINPAFHNTRRSDKKDDDKPKDKKEGGKIPGALRRLVQRRARSAEQKASRAQSEERKKE